MLFLRPLHGGHEQNNIFHSFCKCEHFMQLKKCNQKH